LRETSKLLTPQTVLGAAAVYVLCCSDGTLYTGATSDLERRLSAHQRGKGAKYTRGRLPVRLLAWWGAQSLAAAQSHEARFKRLSRSAKLAALGGEAIYGCAIHRVGRPYSKVR
jgi:putative endonuclease